MSCLSLWLLNCLFLNICCCHITFIYMPVKFVLYLWKQNLRVTPVNYRRYIVLYTLFLAQSLGSYRTSGKIVNKECNYESKFLRWILIIFITYSNSVNHNQTWHDTWWNGFSIWLKSASKWNYLVVAGSILTTGK